MDCDEKLIKEFLGKFSEKYNLITVLDEGDCEKREYKTKQISSENIIKTFGKMNTDGSFGMFWCPAVFSKPRRMKTNVVSIRAIWCEDDEKRDSPRMDWPIPPNYIVNSSPGKYHYYWRTYTESCEDHQRVMQCLVEEYNCDKSARDVARMLRLPGTYNKKVSYAPDYPMATCLFIHDEEFSWAEIEESFPPKEVKSVTSKEKSDGSYGFDMTAAMESIRTSEDYHSSMRDIVLSMMNYMDDRKLLQNLITGLMHAVPPENRDERWAQRLNKAHIDELINGAIHNKTDLYEGLQMADDFDDDIIARADELERDLLCPPNTLFGELVEAVYESWWAPNIMIAHCAVVSTIAYLAGGKYRGVDGDRINLQQVVIGETGTGKELLSRGPVEILEECFLTFGQSVFNNIITSAGSAEGIMDTMLATKKHDVLFIKDEIGGLLRESRENEVKAKIMDLALEMYSKADGRMQKRSLSRVNSKPDDEKDNTMYAPHFIISGATTQELLVPNLSLEFVRTGAGARMMFFNCDPYVEPIRENIKELDLSDDILENMLNIFDLSPISNIQHPFHGNLNPPLTRKTNPVKVKYENAEKTRTAIRKMSEKSKKFHGVKRDLSNRIPVNVKKLAMVYAIAENAIEPVITEEMISRAYRIIQNSSAYMYKLFRDEVGENAFDLAKKKCFELIARAEGKLVTKKRLQDIPAMKRLPDNYKRNQVINGLVEDGSIELHYQNKLRKTAACYRVITIN